MRSGHVLVTMATSLITPDNSFVSLEKDTFNNVFLSTYFTESLACISYGPISGAMA